MKKLKVMTVLGTRPEIIRLSRVMAKLDHYCNHITVHTSQNYDYELNEIFYKDLQVRMPNHFLNAAGATASQTIGKIIIAVDKVFEEEKPDALLILGDTNSCLAAIPAKRRKIPIFHMEAGNRCFDQRVPEETNRKIVDHTADINLTYSSIAREYLLRENLPPDRVIKTGSPMFEVLNYYKKSIEASNILTRLKLTEKKYFIVSAHREENVDSELNFSKLMEALNAIAEQFNEPVIISTHPRTQKMIDTRNIKLRGNISLLKPLGFMDYVKLQMCAHAVLSDSGTISEESSVLNFPALNIRETHERPEAMEEASVMMTGLGTERIMQCLSILDQQAAQGDRLFRQVSDYCMPNVSEKVVRIILSYTDYANRNVWRK